MKKRWNIVQVISNAPNAKPLPPTNQGGTEKIVYELTEQLVRLGHRVTLFAPRGSRSRARLVSFPQGLRDYGIAPFVLKRLPRGVNIIHDHTFTGALGRRKPPVPTVNTIHMPRRLQVPHPVYVSNRARQMMGRGRGYFVYNGINPREYEFSKQKKGYLLFMGRLISAKGVIHAIRVAELTNRKLIIAGPIKDFKLFRIQISPRIRRNPNIRYVGAVGGKRKQNLLKHASCLLFPSVWEEPFGLVMLEAMACGTPVLALRNGSVPEVLSGYPNLICRSVGDMAQKVKAGRFPKPHELRAYVVRRFTTLRMAQAYLRLYGRITGMERR